MDKFQNKITCKSLPCTMQVVHLMSCSRSVFEASCENKRSNKITRLGCRALYQPPRLGASASALRRARGVLGHYILHTPCASQFLFRTFLSLKNFVRAPLRYFNHECVRRGTHISHREGIADMACNGALRGSIWYLLLFELSQPAHTQIDGYEYIRGMLHHIDADGVIDGRTDLHLPNQIIASSQGYRSSCHTVWLPA